MRIEIDIKKILYIISSAFILTTKFWGIYMVSNLKNVVFGIWCLYTLFSYMCYDRVTYTKKVINTNFFLMAIPFGVILLYSLGLWGFQEGILIRNVTRLCSTMIYLILAWGYACVGVYFFKNKGIDYIFTGGVISYTVGSIIYLVVSQGLGGSLIYIKSLFTGETTAANYAMEVNDLTFAMGMFFLYYCFFEDKSVKNHKLKIWLSALLVFMGLKRVEVVALIVAVLAHFILLKWCKNIRFRAYFVTIVYVVISLLFVYLIYSGLLLKIVTQYGITGLKGRADYYTYANRYYTFSWNYLGRGWTYFSRLFQQLYYSGYRINGAAVPASIHSDILTMFIECGCPMFIFWIYYEFAYKSIVLSKKFGTSAGEASLLITIFIFILYLTDNTLIYTGTQIAFCLVPMTVSWTNSKNSIDLKRD